MKPAPPLPPTTLTSTLMASPGPPDSPEGVESPPRRWKRSHGVPARPLAVLLEALPVNSARHDTTRGCTGAVDQSFNAAVVVRPQSTVQPPSVTPTSPRRVRDFLVPSPPPPRRTDLTQDVDPPSASSTLTPLTQSPILQNDHPLSDDEVDQLASTSEDEFIPAIVKKPRLESNISATWAARILSPIVKGQLRAQEVVSKGGASTEDSDEELNRALAEVLDAPRKRKLVRGQALMREPTTESEADTISATEVSSRPRTNRSKRRKVTRNYSSSDGDDDYVPSSHDAPTLVRRTRPVAPLAMAPRYLGDDATPPSKRTLTAPYRTRANAVSRELSFDTQSQLEEEEHAYYFPRRKVVPSKKVSRTPSRRNTKTFLRSIEDTSFASPAIVVSETELDVIEDVEEARKKKTVTSRMPSFAEVEKMLDDEREKGDGVPAKSKAKEAKQRPAMNRTRSRYPQLEMIAEEEFEADCVANHAREAQAGVRRRCTSVAILPQVAQAPKVVPKEQTIVAARVSIPRARPQDDTSARRTPPQRSIEDLGASRLKRSHAAASTCRQDPVVVHQDPSKKRRVDPVVVRPTTPQQESRTVAIDPVTLLPTPVAPRFRFITGPKVKRRPRLEFTQTEQHRELTPPPMEFPPVRAGRQEEVDQLATTSLAESDAVEDVDVSWAGAQQVERSFDSSLEYANVVIPDSQFSLLDFHRTPTPSASPSLSTRSRSRSRSKSHRQMSRKVTFSSPVATPYKSQTLTPEHTPVLRRRMTRSNTLGRSSRGGSRTSPLRRTKTLPAGITKTTPSSSRVDRTTSSSGKLFRRMSLVPQFIIASQEVAMEEQEREVEPSYVPPVRRYSPRSLSPVSLSLPPAAQTTTAGRSSSSESEEDEETNSFNDLLIDCLDEEADHEVYDELEEGVSLPFLSTAHLPASKPSPFPSSPRLPLTVRVSSDPNAILSLPSSFPHRHHVSKYFPVMRATTVGFGGVHRGGREEWV